MFNKKYHYIDSTLIEKLPEEIRAHLKPFPEINEDFIKKAVKFWFRDEQGNVSPIFWRSMRDTIEWVCKRFE